MHQMSVAEFLSTLADAPPPLVVLYDAAASDGQTLRIAYDCTSGWLSLPASSVKSIAIIDYVYCSDGQSYHKVSIVLNDVDAARLMSGLRASRVGAKVTGIGGRQPFDFPINVGFYQVAGSQPGALAIAFDPHGSGAAIGLTWIPASA